MGEHRVIKVALAGNPNVGKSSLFNALTGMHQHTGNWPGKTVDVATGVHKIGGTEYLFTDLPGCYSLTPHSAEEEVTRDHIMSGDADAAVVVCDASLLERNLILALQVIDVCQRTVVVLNLMDEAEKSGVTVDTDKLRDLLGVPVVCTDAKSGRGLPGIPVAIKEVMDIPAATDVDLFGDTEKYVAQAEKIASKVTTHKADVHNRKTAFHRRLDRILTGRFTGLPVMLMLLCGIMWLTVEGANYPSQGLSYLFDRLGEVIRDFLVYIRIPQIAISCLMDGVYLVTAWVVSVMLPPMAIFFPLFTLLEDVGYLPRIAYNLDKPLQKCKACGKQALTMWSGFTLFKMT